MSFAKIKQIKELDLSLTPSLDFARDMFLFSFCTRGMSFVDMAYLKKKDLKNGYLTYRRKKTGQLLTVEWTRQMQGIIDKYPINPTQYLLPLILREDGSERRQYQNQMMKINRHLKDIASLIKLPVCIIAVIAGQLLRVGKIFLYPSSVKHWGMILKSLPKFTWIP